MKKSHLFSVLAMTAVLGTSLVGSSAEVQRKSKSKVSPQYPELAKKMRITGAVKLEIVISSAGTVDSVRPLGGHPLLIDSAVAAVKQWKYEPGAKQTEVVEIRFDANQ